MGVLDKLTDKLHAYTYANQQDWRDVFMDLFIYEHREVDEIWRLIPESMWAHYESQGYEGLRHQLLLNAALSNLKNKFREIVKRVKEAEKSKSN